MPLEYAFSVWLKMLRARLNAEKFKLVIGKFVLYCWCTLDERDKEIFLV